MTYTPTRLSLVLAAGLLAAAAGFAWLVTPRALAPADPARPPADAVPVAQTPASAEAAFDAHCGACHTAASLTERFRTASDAAALRTRFEAFLGDHGDADEADDRRILDWLMKAR